MITNKNKIHIQLCEITVVMSTYNNVNVGGHDQIITPHCTELCGFLNWENIGKIEMEIGRQGVWLTDGFSSWSCRLSWSGFDTRHCQLSRCSFCGKKVKSPQLIPRIRTNWIRGRKWKCIATIQSKIHMYTYPQMTLSKRLVKWQTVQQQKRIFSRKLLQLGLVWNKMS